MKVFRAEGGGVAGRWAYVRVCTYVDLKSSMTPSRKTTHAVLIGSRGAL